MGRAPCCDKGSVKRGPWSPQEDATLTSYIHKHGTGGNWIALPRKAGLNRCGKSCRLRWLNYLRPDIKHGAFTHDEDNLIFTLYSTIGSRWAVIASQLPGRTDNDVKNHWNTKLKKKFNSFSKTPNAPTLTVAAASQHNNAIPPPFSAAANSLILDEHDSKSTNLMFSGPFDFKQPNFEPHYFGPQDQLFPMSNPVPELLSTSSSFSSLPIVEQNHHLPLSGNGGGSDDDKLLLNYGAYDYQYPYEDVTEGFDAINYGSIINYLPEA